MIYIFLSCSIYITTTTSSTYMSDRTTSNLDSYQQQNLEQHSFDLNNDADADTNTLAPVLSGSHFLIVGVQEKASRLGNMMHTISIQESQIAFTRNQLETLQKLLDENKTTVTNMQTEMLYYSKLTHVDPATKASGMGYMSHQISIHDSQNTTLLNQIKEGTRILQDLLLQLDKMELEMSEFRKLPVC